VNDISLREATTIIEAALAKGRAMGLPPLAVVALDAGGHLKALAREDGATFFRPTIALGKAWGALAMGSSSRRLGERLQDRPSFLASLGQLADGRVVPVAGGVLVRRGADVVGAVGVSGASSDEDEACAIAGIEAAGLTAG
jgi:uncharacterized protein GlcG (DUF336 family)